MLRDDSILIYKGRKDGGGKEDIPHLGQRHFLA
jgi:hypothetical protein